jgi:dipeptidyl aminopeptidase/acylaminoacyl peptidase
MNLGNVGQFSFNKPGTHLAYTIDADARIGNGAYLIVFGTGSIQRLDTEAMDYAQLTWDEEGTALAVLKGEEKEGFLRKTNRLLAYTGLDAGSVQSLVYDPAEDSAFPTDMVLSELGALSWSEDKSKLFFGIKEQETKEKKSDEKVANVDVWHWKDEALQTAQMRRAERDRGFTFKSVLHLKNGRFLRLAEDNMRNVTVWGDGNYGVGRDDKSYLLRLDLSSGKADYYGIDTKTGNKRLIEKMLGRTLGLSPDSRHFLYLKEKELWVYNTETGEKVHLTNGRPGFFVNEDDDRRYDEKPAYGLAGWSKDGKRVLVNHKFDLWSLPLDGGTPKNITAGLGEKEQIRFRYINLEEEPRSPGRRRFQPQTSAPKPIDTDKPLLLSAYGEWTKKSGFFRVTPGGTPQKLVFDDHSYGTPNKAKDADRVMITRETFVQFPDYYVSGLDFAHLKKVTDANPQQAEYAWGRRILIDYENTRGIKLQATLALPAGYQEGTRYPMIVYFYEKMSQRHHQYSMPTYDDRPHMSTYASNGYLVLMPDIVYANGTPGTNAMECVIPAVKKTIELGYTDPKRIGLQGHSWGGYESSFAVTQTDVFACVVTGAPLTNLTSMYNILYKSSGNTNQQAIQFGQGRMGTTPFHNLDLYVSQSPVHQAKNIKVPFMILHGTEDGAVDWNQGLEFYVTARRLGKEVILLSYPGEGHHLSKIENQKDFQLRMKQYFDHYLKGAEAPAWMVQGVPFLKKKEGDGNR